MLRLLWVLLAVESYLDLSQNLLEILNHFVTSKNFLFYRVGLPEKIHVHLPVSFVRASFRIRRSGMLAASASIRQAAQKISSDAIPFNIK